MIKASCVWSLLSKYVHLNRFFDPNDFRQTRFRLSSQRPNSFRPPPRIWCRRVLPPSSPPQLPSQLPPSCRPPTSRKTDRAMFERRSDVS